MGKFKFRESWMEEDLISDQDDLHRSAAQIKAMMSDIDRDLTFTIELEPDFPQGHLPTLDFTMWIKKTMKNSIPAYKVLHNFYMKAVNSK